MLPNKFYGRWRFLVVPPPFLQLHIVHTYYSYKLYLNDSNEIYKKRLNSNRLFNVCIFSCSGLEFADKLVYDFIFSVLLDLLENPKKNDDKIILPKVITF